MEKCVNALKISGISSLGLIALLILALPFSVAHAQETKIPVIVLYKEKITKFHTDNIKERYGQIKKTWKIINGLATDLSPTDIEELKKDPSVLAVEKDLPVHALDITADEQIRADKVWTTGNIGGNSSSRVPVAILDTGIDGTHPEFTGRITLCHSEITNSSTCQDQNGHGTHVAGIVGATGINTNAKGVAPGVQYYIDQVLDSTGSGSFSGIISGIDWAVANHAKVISMSFGSIPLATTEPNCDSQFTSLADAINNAVNAGVTVVAAAGNSGDQGVGAPGCMSNVIAVGAVDNNDTIASWSSTGGPIKDHGIVAPGVNILSTYIPQTYITMSGTSMATPVVTGTVALLLQTNSSLTPAQVKNTLFSTACSDQTNPSCQTSSVPNTLYGYGRVDTLAAYDKINPSNPHQLSVVVTTDKSLYSTGSTAKITVNTSFNSTPISGSTVVIQVKNPSGKTSQMSGMTNTIGKITFSYVISKGHAAAGVYQITTTANAPNYLQGMATTTFTAK